MKTQIINIEPHDDAISVKDKMEWSQSPRILLVWPTHERVLNQRIDLVHLKRHSVSLGAQLAFVTRNRKIKKFAESLDIPVYPNIRKAEISHWRLRKKGGIRNKHTRKINLSKTEPRSIHNILDILEEKRKIAFPEPRAWITHPITRVIFFTLGVVGILAVAAVLIPSAELYITPKIELMHITIPITADPNVTKIELRGSVPVQTINVIVEGRSTTPTTGFLLIPDKKASGYVVFSNLTNEEISIPHGTIVSTTGENSIRFATQRDILVPAYTESGLIPIEALNPGSGGNQSPNSIIAIEGPLGLDLTVTNPRSTLLGSERQVPAPQEKDLQTLDNDLLEKLYQAALLEINNKIGEKDTLLRSDPSEYTIIKSEFNPEENQPGDFLSLLLQVEFYADIVSGDDILVLCNTVIDSNVPDGFQTFPATIEVINQNPPELLNEEMYSWNIDVTWKVGAIIDNHDAVNMILWQNPATAVNKLIDAIPVDQNVIIIMKPSWWPRLPILPFRIKVISAL